MIIFISTIDILAGPSCNKPPLLADGLIDEVHDVERYQDIIRKFIIDAKGELYMLLPVIGYIDKTKQMLIRGIIWNHFYLLSLY